LVDGSLESPCRVLVKCNGTNFFFYLLRLRRYKAKRVKTRCLQEGAGHLEPRFQEKGVVPGEYFFGFYKARHILLSDSANCTVLRAVVLTQYRRVTDRRTDGRTDGQTDGIVVASTALAMRALRRAVKWCYFLRRSVEIVTIAESLQTRHTHIPGQ